MDPQAGGVPTEWLWQALSACPLLWNLTALTEMEAWEDAWVAAAGRERLLQQPPKKAPGILNASHQQASSYLVGGGCFLLRLFGSSGRWIANNTSRRGLKTHRERLPSVLLWGWGSRGPRWGGHTGEDVGGTGHRTHVLDLPSTPALSEPSLPLVSEGPWEGGACEDMSPHAWEPSGVRAAGGGLRKGAPQGIPSKTGCSSFLPETSRV